MVSQCCRVLTLVGLLSVCGSGWSADAAVLPKNPTLERLDFRDIKLADAGRMISEQTGLNVMVSQEAGKVSVSLLLYDVPAQTAIEALCKNYNLWYKVDQGILRIMTTDEFQRDLTSFREQKTEIFTLMYPNALPIALAIRDLFGSRVQFSPGSDSSDDEATDLQARLSRFDIIDQRSQGLGLFGSGGTTVSGGGGGTNGGGFTSSTSGSLVSGAGNNRFNNQFNSVPAPLVNNGRTNQGYNEFRNLTPEQTQAVQKLITKAGPEGEAEAAAALEAFRVQPTTIYVTISRRNNLVIVRTSDKQSMDEIKDLVKQLDRPTALVLLEVKVLSLELDDSFNSVFDYQFSDGVNNAGGFNSGEVQPPAADTLTGQARKAASLAVGGTAVQSGDFVFQYINKNFRARMQLLEAKNKITTLATPMLMTANNEVSRLFVGEERPIIRNISSQSVVNNNTVTSTPNTTVEFRPVGTTLLITPNINSDKTVTLRLLQENSSIVSNAATIPVVSGNGNVSNQPVDVVSTRTVSGTVVAKDELELAVGGLIEDGLNDTRSMVPGIGKVPVLGYFFRRQQSSRTKHELIVVIRPHVVSTPYEAECISKKLLGELSLHPSVPDVQGTLNTFTPREVLRPNPPTNKKEHILHLDNQKQDED